MQIRLYILTGMLCLATAAHAQEPVAWTYAAKPIGPRLYAIHITANINPGWHIYAQHQPKDAISTPTSITYTANPLLSLQGPIKEDGNIFHYRNQQMGFSQDQYSDKVDFITVVKLKALVKTRISGTLTYQVCTDEQCLPAASKTFSISLPPADSEGSK